ncbi:tRNA 2-thiouridine synthesizing protein E [Desulfitispora alkaliphila]|uniref:TusE/DsrC/DsvC family sulfur relay protein n=1 Tax=Desulfitispora alkaliphila TaxID=622674 RepID=UPI003D213142
MSNIEVNGKSIELDEDGFLVNPEDWNEDVALILAKAEEVEELTEDHWKLINYLQDYFKQFGIAPMVRKLTKQSGYSLKEIYELFPSGPAKGACKIAGLPKPTGCV